MVLSENCLQKIGLSLYGMNLLFHRDWLGISDMFFGSMEHILVHRLIFGMHEDNNCKL